MSQFVIGLLGGLTISVDGEVVSHFESVKVRALLAYLAAEAGRPQNRTTLAGLLWPDWPEEAASKNLRHTLYSLRKALGDPTCLEADRQWITLAAGVRQRNRIRAGAVLYTDPGEPARLYARGVAIFARSQGVNL